MRRFLRGETSSLSPERVATILQALTSRFLFEDPLVVRLHAPSAEDLAVMLGVSGVAELRRACDGNARLRTFVENARDPAPALRKATRTLFEHLVAWEDFAAARCPRPPRQAAPWLLAQFRMAVVDLAIFYGYLAFKLRMRPSTEAPTWARTPAADRFVRQLIKDHGFTRQKLVGRLAGDRDATTIRTTVDLWCDEGRRPQDASLKALSMALEGDSARRALLHQALRRHFALRELLDDLRAPLGDAEVENIINAFLRLSAATFDRLARTRVQPAFQATICDFVLADWMRTAPSPQLVEHLLAVEHERRWTVALRGMRLAMRVQGPTAHGALRYPRRVAMTELTDATSSDIFVPGP